MDNESIRKTYRRYAAGYDLMFGPLFGAGRRTLVQRMDLQPGKRVLEVGVGTGLSLPLYPEGVDVVGIDLSPEMLQRARRRCRPPLIRSQVGLALMDAEAMGFADAIFDTVAAMYVATVSPHPAHLVAEMSRVCKPGGDIFILNHFASDNPVLGSIERALAPLSRGLGWRPDFSLEEFLRETGLKPLERTPVNLFGYWMLLRMRNTSAAAEALQVAEDAAGP